LVFAFFIIQNTQFRVKIKLKRCNAGNANAPQVNLKAVNFLFSCPNPKEGAKTLSYD
jgi:hypothetical protein